MMAYKCIFPTCKIYVSMQNDFVNMQLIYLFLLSLSKMCSLKLRREGLQLMSIVRTLSRVPHPRLTRDIRIYGHLQGTVTLTFIAERLAIQLSLPVFMT